jgi:hypothetical protein
MSDPTFNEPNQSSNEPSQSEYQAEYQPPLPPSDAKNIEDQEPVPVISEPASLVSIFYEPSRVFESFRAKPRFFLAMVIVLALSTTWVGVYLNRVGFENFMRANMEKSPQASQMSKSDIDKAVAQQSLPIVKYFIIGTQPIAIIFFFFLFVVIYFFGAMLMGGKLSFLQSMSITAYSWFPLVVISSVLNFILLFVQSTDSYDVAGGIRGLVKANLGFLVTAKEHPILEAVLSSFDVFQFFGLFLIAMGLRIVGRISSGLAWTIAIAVWLLGVAIRVLLASIFGG